MMKILLMNPRIDAGHKILQEFESRGIGLLLPRSGNEALAVLQLHGESVDLIILHREGANGEGKAGLELVGRLKSEERWAQIPYILTTEKWSAQECEAHQKTQQGAQAYVSYPFEVNDLIQVCEKVLGEKFSDPRPQESGEDTRFLQSPETSQPEVSLDPPEPSIHIDQATTFQPISLESPSEVEPIETEAPPSPPEKSIDSHTQSEMPYLFSQIDPLKAFEHAKGDAVVPGGAVESPDSETLKKYLYLREQDVSALSVQLQTAKERIQEMELLIRGSHAKEVELEHRLREKEKRIEEFETEKAIAIESLEKEIAELRFKLKEKTDKAKILESKVREATGEVENIKERVRNDLRKIRVREKELENRLELLKKDSELLVQSRESRIVELKRKIDLLEFNMDLLQDQFAREKSQSNELKKRLGNASKAMRVAGGFLDETGEFVSSDDPEAPSDAEAS